MWTSVVPGGGIGGGQGDIAAMEKGTVKFFNEAKGFGFTPVVDKLCPGHPSCRSMAWRDAYPSDSRKFNDLGY